MTNRRVNGEAPTWRQVLWGAALLALSWAGAGCADHVERAIVTCPCARGVCCESGVCADDENSCEQATRALSSESAGHWTGYIEHFAFPSGSDALDLTLHVEADGSLSGDLILGQGTAPAPPTDGTVGWPPNPDGQGGDWTPKLIEGFVFHVRNLRWTALRLRFDTDLFEPWTPWCEMQTTLFQSGSKWSCAEFLVSIYDPMTGKCWLYDNDAPTTVVDCGQRAVCVSACICTAAGCGIDTAGGSTFDIALRGNEGDGSVWYKGADLSTSREIDGVPHNVRLIRASN